MPHLFGEQLAPAMLDDLEPIVRDWQPDVILHDTWEFAGPVAAASAGIPSISHTLGPRFTDRTVEATAAAEAPLWQQRGLAPESHGRPLSPPLPGYHAPQPPALCGGASA